MLMIKVLQELNWKIALIYIDDILVFSKNFDDHLHHLKLVFQKLKQAKLTLQPSKCHFAAKEVKYLGHIISEHGIQVDKSKTAAVSEYPIPKTVKHLRSFLGMCNYYRKFIQNYSKICSPLTTLLKKDVKFEWTTNQDNAFNTLKQKLTSAPILSFPDFEREFYHATDASDSAIGFVLGQKDDTGLEKVIAYGEGLALVEAIKSFKPYIANNKFTVFTDSITVRWLNSSKDATGRLGRWSLFLQQYDFDIVHRPGTQNKNADALSRRDYTVDAQDKEYHSDENLPEIGSIQAERKEHIAVTFEFGWENSIQIPEVLAIDEDQVKDPDEMLPTRQTLYQLQRNCSDFKPIFDYKLKGLVPDDAQKARSLVAKAYHYEIIEGILYHMLVQALCELCDVTRHYTSSYHPQTNAACERMNSYIIQSLRSYCNKEQTDWPDYIPPIMMAYRSTPATQSTQFSPFEILFGQPMRLPIDVSLIPKQTMPKETKQHVNELVNRLKLYREVAAKNQKDKQDKYTTQHDKNAVQPTFLAGAKVWLYCSRTPKGKSHKLVQRWTGPYRIMYKGPNNTFKIKNTETQKEVKSLIHAKRLKDYHNPLDRPNYLLPEYEDILLDAEEQDDDEGSNIERNKELTELQNMQNEDNNKTQNEGLTQSSVQNHTSIPDKHNLQFKSSQKSNQGTLQNQTRKQNSQDIPFKSNKIEKLVEYSLYQGKPIYKVKFTGKPGTSWQDGSRIPENLKQEYHRQYNAKGQKRKCPGKLKYFESTQSRSIHAIQPHNSFKRTKQNSQQNNTSKIPFNELPKQTIVSVSLDRNQRESRYLVMQVNGQTYNELHMSNQIRPDVFK
ncbi:Retrovirus-related Pol polyprotein from transposon 297,Retrovirus-related Pol polyprotein from transposon 17.6 [Mytilus coruscus]|uniref:Retrovirus-related Pol polyprotein from transposon 297,Retrovirus-related Pol polyprotein from transposon 17.6 n=1 Tax=Mytilus coruscus TaxID=42192 RepID=A0A6J8AUL7_MYTCO|nr:Retrovirus-related Pol polyprotein from transposon 297,Retrovirus-related Pol polyprotein from transposon 17.6 [Mytilus coruscus]